VVTEYGALVAVLLFLTPLDEYCVPFLLEEEEEEEEEVKALDSFRRHDDDHDAFVAKVAQEYADMMSDFTARG
tara:strand:+ start:57 stop:275 length:219 start_codon:yes stop_codon:yes gene_type:complete